MPLSKPHPDKYTYSRVLLVSMILLIVIFGSAITINEYWTIKRNYERNAASLQNQTEANLVQSMKILDAGFRLYDDGLNRQMNNSFSVVMAEYARAGSDPSRMDLPGIKEKLGPGYDIYIINESGVIEYTTYLPDLGLDFKTTPYFYDYLTKIRRSDGFFSDRVVNELNTGLLRKYAYMPSPDHRYIFELGFSEPELRERRSLVTYQEELDKIVYFNPFVKDMAIYDVEKHLVANFSRVADEATGRDLDTVMGKRERITVDDPDAGVRIVYLYIDLKDERYGSDVSRIIRLTYDTSRIRQELTAHLMPHLIVVIGAIVLAIIFAFLVSRYLARPITAIVSDVDAIAKGDLDHTISSTSWREFRVLEDSVNTMVKNIKTSLEKERQVEQRFRNLVETTSDVVWEVNRDMAFTYVSPRVTRITGYDPEEILGKTLFNLMEAEEAELIAPLFKQVLENRAPFSFFESTIRTRDCRKIIIESSGVPVFDPDGSFTGYRGIFRDVTRRRQDEEELRQLYNDLEIRVEKRTAELRAAEESARLANMKLNLLGSVTRHDVGNSLTIVLGFIKIAKQASDPALMVGFLEKIEAAARNIQKQIAFTKEYQDLGVKAPQWHDVSAQIGKASQLTSGGSARITDETSGLEVYADPLLEKVFYNLIDNALKHGGDKLRLIQFTWHLAGGDLVIACKDDGVGIRPEDREQIFKRGFGTNTGLGLFLCREILGITGIALAETGEWGQGACFEIRVPQGAYRFYKKP